MFDRKPYEGCREPGIFRLNAIGLSLTKRLRPLAVVTFPFKFKLFTNLNQTKRELSLVNGDSLFSKKMQNVRRQKIQIKHEYYEKNLTLP